MNSRPGVTATTDMDVIPAKSGGGPPAAGDPDNVPAKAGNQTPNDVIDLSLDSGSRTL